ncbi:MAG: futalosine hydrolase [Planctomycetes bacterium]|nr:futalosine hydrolase [Planctomycetota bacterium]
MPNGDSGILLLVPTDLERRALAPRLGDRMPIELCGFGPVAAAARTAGLLAARRPARVLLIGIAGRLDDRLAIGAACRFAAVACFGIGAGTGVAFQPAATLGWPQWPGGEGGPAGAIGDVIGLAHADTDAVPATGLLLTACAASAGTADVDLRRRLVPDAMAEDMEGFGVATACRLAGVPLDIVRGISNTAGDRDHAGWRIDDALAAAAGVARRVLETPR